MQRAFSARDNQLCLTALPRVPTPHFADASSQNCNSFPVWIPPTVDVSVKTYESYFKGGQASSLALCQDLYDRTSGELTMPIVCNGHYTAY